jgi:hypothetical protein
MPFELTDPACHNRVNRSPNPKKRRPKRTAAQLLVGSSASGDRGCPAARSSTEKAKADDHQRPACRLWNCSRGAAQRETGAFAADGAEALYEKVSTTPGIARNAHIGAVKEAYEVGTRGQRLGVINRDERSVEGGGNRRREAGRREQYVGNLHPWRAAVIIQKLTFIGEEKPPKLDCTANVTESVVVALPSVNKSKTRPPPQLLQYPLVSGLTVRSGTDWKRVAAPVGNAKAANKTAAINFAQFVPHVAQIVANRDINLLLFQKIELDLDKNVKDEKKCKNPTLIVLFSLTYLQ